VKLLFDENISPKLVATLANVYPGSAHVRTVGLRAAEDARIWDYAHAQGFAIASKDTDFRERSYVEGFPPKIIWLDVGNAGTAAIAELLRNAHERIGRFEREEVGSRGRRTRTACFWEIYSSFSRSRAKPHLRTRP
jgi:predicted nuclease of predicted toxin-antitoxin system